MARVNLEDRFFGESRLQRFARRMRWDIRTASGCLAFLWHESQSLMRVDGSADDLADWCLAKSDAEGEKIVSGLLRSGYITEDGDRFTINGNSVQIDGIVNCIKKGQKGGDATRAKWSAIKEKKKQILDADLAKDQGGLGQGCKPTTARPQLGSMQGNAMQGNAKQCNANQASLFSDPPEVDQVHKDDKKKDHNKEPGKTTKSYPVWSVYREEYVRLFGSYPLWNREQGISCCQIIDKVGKDLAPDLIRFYMRHPNGYYKQQGYKLRSAVNDWNSLVTQMQKRQLVTPTSARRDEKFATNDIAIAEHLARKQAREEPREAKG